MQPQPPAELLNPARGPRESEVRALQHEAQGLQAESAAMATEAHELAGGEAVETTLIGDVTPGENDVASPASPAVPALSPASPVPALDAAPGSSTGAAAAAVQQAQAREAEVAGLEARMRQIERAANQQASGTGGPAPQMAPLAQAVPQSAQPGDIPRKVVANQYTHVSGSSGLATAVLAETLAANSPRQRASSKAAFFSRRSSATCHVRKGPRPPESGRERGVQASATMQGCPRARGERDMRCAISSSRAEANNLIVDSKAAPPAPPAPSAAPH
mgnify:CR=1 FL=1